MLADACEPWACSTREVLQYVAQVRGCLLPNQRLRDGAVAARCRVGDFLPAGQQFSDRHVARALARSEEHTSELQSLMRHSYAVFCLKKKQLNTTKKAKKQ